MTELVLQYPVTNLEGQEILPAGTVLTNKTIDKVIHKSQKEKYPIKNLMEHNTVFKDFQRFLGMPPYHIIFSDQTRTQYLFDLFKKVRLPLPLLKILDYFKENDFHTYRHSLTVYALATYLIKVLGVCGEETGQEFIAGPVHDFGMVNVPLDIITKETSINMEEEAILKHHILAGYVLLCYYFQESKSITVRLALEHHERVNGTGSLGIKTQNKLVEIVAVCDIYDALISQRPYRPIPYKNRAALEELTAMAEKGDIGWDALKALIALNREQKPERDEVIIPSKKREKPPADNVYGNREGI